MRVAVEYRQASKETWERFCKAHPELEVDYLSFQNVIYTFNYNFRDYLLETGKKGRLPWGFGDFVVNKYKRKETRINKSTGEEIINLPIDWKKTRELGKHVYHLNFSTNRFNFKWKWFPKTARFKSCDIFNFKPSRLSSRMITHYVNLPGNPHKDLYLEWDSL